MGRVSFSIVGVLLLFSIISVVSCGEATEIPPEDYLAWPKIDYSNQDDLHARIRMTLERFAKEEGLNWNVALNIVMDRLNRARRSKEYTFDEREIVSQIYRLESDLSCDTRVTDLIQSITVQMKDGKLPESLQRSFKEIIDRCIDNCARESRKWLVDSGLLQELDRTFAIAFGKRYDHNKFSHFGAQLARLLGNFNFFTDKYNAKQMVACMRKLESGDGSAEKAEPYDLLKDFMLSRCERFDESLKDSIAMFDLIRKFGRNPNWSPYLRRLDEYNRFCLALKSPEKEELLRKNFEEQLVCRGDKCGLASLWQNNLSC